MYVLHSMYEKRDGWHADSYKRVKGRSHTVDKRISLHPHKPHSTSQPSQFSHTVARTESAPTHHMTSTATNSAPYTCPIMASALALQSQHRNANPAPAR